MLLVISYHASVGRRPQEGLLRNDALNYIFSGERGGCMSCVHVHALCLQGGVVVANLHVHVFVNCIFK